MVITNGKLYNNYLDDDEIIVTKIRDKYKRKDKNNINGSSKLKCIFLIAIIFIVGTTLMIQHTKISNINNEIINLEQELKEIRMINDSKEGELLSYYDLDSIEEIAKDKLGMVEPSSEQYTYLVLSDVQDIAKVNGEEEAEKTNKTVSWLARLID